MTTRSSPATPPQWPTAWRHPRRWLPVNGALAAAAATLSPVVTLLVVASLASAAPASSASRPTTATSTMPATPRTRAAATVATLRARTPRLAVQWVWTQPGPQVVGGLAAITRGATVEARARFFLRAHEALLGGVATADLRLDHVSRANGRNVARFAQSWHGLPVLGRFVAVAMDLDGTVRHLSSDAHPVHKPSRGAVGADLAGRRALLAMSRADQRNAGQRSAGQRSAGQRSAGQHSPAQNWRVQRVTEVIDLTPSGAVHGYAVDLIGAPAARMVRVVVRSADGVAQRVTDRLRR